MAESIFGKEVVLDHATNRKDSYTELACKTRVNKRVCRFIFIETGRPESDLTEHLITQQFHNTKVTKVTWGKGVFTEWIVG